LFRCITGVSANGSAIFVGSFGSTICSSARWSAWSSCTRGVFSDLSSVSSAFAGGTSFGASIGAGFGCAAGFAFSLLVAFAFAGAAAGAGSLSPDSRADRRCRDPSCSSGGASGKVLFARVNADLESFSSVAMGAAFGLSVSATLASAARGFFDFAREK